MRDRSSGDQSSQSLQSVSHATFTDAVTQSVTCCHAAIALLHSSAVSRQLVRSHPSKKLRERASRNKFVSRSTASDSDGDSVRRDLCAGSDDVFGAFHHSNIT